jgi:SpoVK/Ycf46/Vps4 family AAA+-type ATPase
VTAAAKAPKDQAAELEAERKAEEAAERSALDNKFSAWGYIVMPSEARAPILDLATRRALSEWMAEFNAKKALAAVGVVPRSRMLLDGPPGCGKTTLGHHVAARLGLPMLVVTAHTLVSSFIGRSGENIGKLFKESRKVPTGIVLFFDEFDAIAKDRNMMGGQAADQERANITIALLSELDRHTGMLFAATNMDQTLDAAIQRRFQMRMEIPLPGKPERDAIVRLYLQPLQVDDDLADALSDVLAGASPALIKDMMEAIKRGLVLGPKLQLDTALPALVRRAMQSIKPHDAANIPILWTGVREQLDKLEAAAEGRWPPVIP